MIGLAFGAMAEHHELWQHYFTDFIAYKLKLVGSQSDIAQQLWRAYFNQLHYKEMPHRVVELHCHANIFHRFLAQMTAILRSLNKMDGVRKAVADSTLLHYFFLHSLLLMPHNW
jgi:hypothetical protein